VRIAGRSLRRRLLKVTLVLLAVGAGLYLLLLIALFSLQTRLLFPGAGPAPALPRGAERLSLDLRGGERLHGVHIPPEPGADADRLLILGFGGNAWNAEAAASELHALFPRSDVVSFHYRGYPPSTGTPAAAALLADAPVVLDHVANRFRHNRIVVTGFSVGTAAAARLAVDRRVSGVILVTPFDSLHIIARSHFPWAPVRLLLRHRLEPIEDVRRVTAPIAIIAAGEDEIVPASSTQGLARGANHLVFERVIPESDHNSIYRNPAFAEAMHKALGAVTGR
jgi:pimeloyl-ACP methyl ester carboxylesterase